MDEYTAAELAYQRGYEAGLTAQYGQALTALLKERDELKARLHETKSEWISTKKRMPLPEPPETSE